VTQTTLTGHDRRNRLAESSFDVQTNMYSNLTDGHGRSVVLNDFIRNNNSIYRRGFYWFYNDASMSTRINMYVRWFRIIHAIHTRRLLSRRHRYGSYEKTKIVRTALLSVDRGFPNFPRANRKRVIQTIFRKTKSVAWIPSSVQISDSAYLRHVRRSRRRSFTLFVPNQVVVENAENRLMKKKK